MRSVLEQSLAFVRGALETESTAGGTVFQRAPRAGRALLTRTGLDYVSATASGVRLEVVTDAAVIELDLEITRALYPGTASDGSTFDVVVDGVAREPIVVAAERIVYFDLVTGGVEIGRGAPSTLRVELGAAGQQRAVEIWFPVVSVVALADVRVPEEATWGAGREAPVWVHHGSSISQASDAGRALATWPVIVARSAGLSVVNLGLAGQCQLDPFMARAIRDTPAAVISLELGINVVNLDTMRERSFVPAVHGFLDTIREGQPGTPLVIISPLICPVHEDRPGPTQWGEGGTISAPDRPVELASGALTLRVVRRLLAEAVATRRSAGDGNLHYVDGLELLGPDDVPLLSDGLHPDRAGQAVIAERFEPRVLRIGAARG